MFFYPCVLARRHLPKMSPPPRALPKSPKVLRARPPRVCCFSPRSHPEPRVAARPVLLSQIHPTSPLVPTHQSWRPGSNRRPPFRGAAPLPAHCSSPKSTPPRVHPPFSGAGDRAAPPAAASRSRRPRESRRSGGPAPRARPGAAPPAGEEEPRRPREQDAGDRAAPRCERVQEPRRPRSRVVHAESTLRKCARGI